MPEPVSQTRRFSLYLWNSGSAPFTRLQMTHNQEQLETHAAKFRVGVSGAMGAATAAENEKTFYYNSSDNRLYFSDGNNWVPISGFTYPSDLDSTIAGSGLSLNTSTGLAVNVDNSTLEVSSDNLRVKANGITESQLKTVLGAEAVVTAAIRADAVTQDKIADDAVRKEHIKDGEVVAGKLGTNAVALVNMQDDSVDTSEIRNLAVTGAKLANAPSGITTTKINDGQVTGAKMANAPDGITVTKINDQAVETGKIKDLAVTTDKINSLAVVTGKIENLAVTTAKLANAPDGVTVDKINDQAVETAKIKDLAVTNEKVGNAAVTPQKILGVSGIAKGSLVTASDTNTFTTLAAGTNGQYLVAASGETSGLVWATLGVTQPQVTFDAITGGSQPAWLTWTGPATAPVVNSGSLDGYTFTLGNLVWVHIRLQIGSDTTKGADNTAWQFGIPVAAVSGRPQIIPGYVANGDLSILRPITGVIRPGISAGSASRIGLLTTPDGGLVHRQHPFLWPTDSFLILEGWYQKA